VYYQAMSAVVADETTGGSCTRSGAGIPGASPKGSGNERREMSDRGGSHWREEGEGAGST
jgi:hypothetical protein